ncbi:hypothetical protein GGF37_003994 [Kickxella alabastrina]|nr:hypothetical protein GGF37_003994 [Kickxella alabastrina]
MDFEFLLQRASDDWGYVVDWSKVLGPAELYAVSICRLLYHSPRFAIVDETLDCLQPDQVRQLFVAARMHRVTLLALAESNPFDKETTHGACVACLSEFTRVLRVSRDAWEFGAVGSAQQQGPVFGAEEPEWLWATAEDEVQRRPGRLLRRTSTLSQCSTTERRWRTSDSLGSRRQSYVISPSLTVRSSFSDFSTIDQSSTFGSGTARMLAIDNALAKYASTVTRTVTRRQPLLAASEIFAAKIITSKPADDANSNANNEVDVDNIEDIDDISEISEIDENSSVVEDIDKVESGQDNGINNMEEINVEINTRVEEKVEVIEKIDNELIEVIKKIEEIKSKEGVIEEIEEIGSKEEVIKVIEKLEEKEVIKVIEKIEEKEEAIEEIEEIEDKEEFIEAIEAIEVIENIKEEKLVEVMEKEANAAEQEYIKEVYSPVSARTLVDGAAPSMLEKIRPESPVNFALPTANKYQRSSRPRRDSLHRSGAETLVSSPQYSGTARKSFSRYSTADMSLSLAVAGMALITGASRGIGRSVSKILLARGVSVIGVARSAEKLLEVQNETKDYVGKFISCTADLTQSADIDAVHAAVTSSGLSLIGLVNNAGVIEPLAKLADIKIADLQKHLDVNVTAVVAITQSLLPLLRESRGRIVNVSSGAATHAYQGWGAYCTSKAALNMVTQILAAEEPSVVSVALRPGVVATDMQEQIREQGKGAMVAGELAKFVNLHTSGGLLAPERPAQVIAALALEADPKLSGGFFSWDSAEVAQYSF